MKCMELLQDGSVLIVTLFSAYLIVVLYIQKSNIERIREIAKAVEE